MYISVRKFLRRLLHIMCAYPWLPQNWITRRLIFLLLIVWNIIFLAVYLHFCFETNNTSHKSLTKDLIGTAAKTKRTKSIAKGGDILLQEVERNACSVRSLGGEFLNIKENSDEPFCRLSRISDELCKEILSRFKAADNNVCSDKRTKICGLSAQSDNEGLHYVLKCPNQDRLCDGQELFLGYISPESGILVWEKLTKGDNLTKVFTGILRKNKQTSTPFIMIRCGIGTHQLSQLMLLPSSFVLQKKEEHSLKTSHKSININIVLLDSVSRPHFFRSLPQTVATMRQINSQKSSSVVLDFDLYQAVKARTYENLYTFFTGETPEMSNDLLSNVSILSPLPVYQLFKDLKLSGYQTLWQEDLCWLYDWGLVRNLKAHDERLSLSKRWEILQKMFHSNAIDNLGVTHASCEILRKYGLQDPFLHPPRLCFNGKFHHEYMLEFLQDSIKTTSIDSSIFKPIFALSIFNTPHENSGLRLQTMDKSLQLFVQEMANNQDTLSVIFSDHGNTYGLFPNTIHGRFEQFNPSLFMIIPENVQKLIGNTGLDILKKNQHRLLTIKDLRKVVMAFTKVGKASVVIDKHTFHHIPHNRTCDDLSIMDASLCICEGWNSKVTNNPLHTMIAEFALSQLNTIIHKQKFGTGYRDVNIYSPCQRLVAEELQEVHERRSREKIIVQMDLIVQFKEMFNVEVEMSFNDSLSVNLKLVSFSRVSQYALFKVCSDPLVDLQLCICDQAKKFEESKLVNRKPIVLHWKDYSPIFGVRTQGKEMHQQCLFILTREHPGGVVFEAASLCQYIEYTVNIKFDVVNMRIVDYPLEMLLQPGSIQFLTVLIPADPGLNWKWSYYLDYSWRQL